MRNTDIADMFDEAAQEQALAERHEMDVEDAGGKVIPNEDRLPSEPLTTEGTDA